MRITQLVFLAISLFTLNAQAANNAPWGHAPVIEKEYSKQKVVYDVAAKAVAAITSVLGRASHVSRLNGGHRDD